MSVAAKTYILTGDGTAVESADGKVSGVLLVAAGGTIDDAVARKYGVETRDPAAVQADVDALERQRYEDLMSRRASLMTTGAQGSGATASEAMAASAQQTATAIANKTSPLEPINAQPAADTKAPEPASPIIVPPSGKA